MFFISIYISGHISTFSICQSPRGRPERTEGLISLATFCLFSWIYFLYQLSEQYCTIRIQTLIYIFGSIIGRVLPEITYFYVDTPKFLQNSNPSWNSMLPARQT